MNILKKITALLLVFTLVFSFAACTGGDVEPTGLDFENGPTVPPVVPEDPDRGDKKVNIAAVEGVGGLPFLRLSLDRGYAYNLVGTGASPTEVADMLKSNKISIAAVGIEDIPVLAAQTDIRILAVSAKMTLSAMMKKPPEGEDNSSKSRDVYCGGKDTAVQYVAEEIFREKGTSNVTFLTDEEINEKMKNGEDCIFILQEPEALYATASYPDYSRASTLTNSWSEDYVPAYSCIVARGDFVDANPLTVKEFLVHIEGITNSFATETGAIYTALEFVKKGWYSSNETAMKAVNTSGIVYVEKEEMKKSVKSTLDFLNAKNPAIGQVDDSVFYMG